MMDSDYLKLNKMSCAAGIVKTDDCRKFRQRNANIRLKFNNSEIAESFAK